MRSILMGSIPELTEVHGYILRHVTTLQLLVCEEAEEDSYCSQPPLINRHVKNWHHSVIHQSFLSRPTVYLRDMPLPLFYYASYLKKYHQNCIQYVLSSTLQPI
jgi:hypothetical protein